MKKIYVISIMNSLNQMVSYTIITSNGLAAAIASAQKKAGVTTDPRTTQETGTVDIEAE